jgi:hypothetical protein
MESFMRAVRPLYLRKERARLLAEKKLSSWTATCREGHVRVGYREGEGEA